MSFLDAKWYKITFKYFFLNDCKKAVSGTKQPYNLLISVDTFGCNEVYDLKIPHSDPNIAILGHKNVKNNCENYSLFDGSKNL